MKDQLIQLIQAYADSYGSGNAILKQLAGSQLQSFISSIEIVESQQAIEESSKESGENE
jgi:hypothetical protein